jgi:hypothetical protein
VREGGRFQKGGFTGLHRFLLNLVKLLTAQPEILLESDALDANFTLSFACSAGTVVGAPPLRRGLEYVNAHVTVLLIMGL